MIDLDTHPRSYVHAPFTEEQVACIRAYQDRRHPERYVARLEQ